MTTFITLITTGPMAGDYDRKHQPDLEQAFCHAFDEINAGKEVHIEIQNGDYVHVLDPVGGTYRAAKDTPA